jgi:hypothetical protein
MLQRYWQFSVSYLRPNMEHFYVRFVRDRMEVGQILHRVLRIFPVSVIPAVVRTHSSLSNAI